MFKETMLLAIDLGLKTHKVNKYDLGEVSF